MADNFMRTRRTLTGLAAIAATVTIIAGTSATAEAAQRQRHDRAHDVIEAKSNDGLEPTSTRKAPHVRADDITDVTAAYRSHHVTTELKLRGRDYYSDEEYTFAFESNDGFLIVGVFADPVFPKGEAFSIRINASDFARSDGEFRKLARQARDSGSHACTGIHTHLTARSAGVTVPAWCVERAGTIGIDTSALRIKGSRMYMDDAKTLHVKRG